MGICCQDENVKFTNEVVNRKTSDISMRLTAVNYFREVVGVATTTHIISMMVNKKVEANDPVEKAILRHFIKVSLQSILGLVYSILEKSSFLLVIEKNLESKSQINKFKLLTKIRIKIRDIT